MSWFESGAYVCSSPSFIENGAMLSELQTKSKCEILAKVNVK